MKRRLLKILVVVVLVYLMITVFIMTKLQTFLQQSQNWNPSYEHDHWYQQQPILPCITGEDHDYGHLIQKRSRFNSENGLARSYNCVMHQLAVDIQMEAEWTNIDTSYPEYMVSASGWLDVIKVTSWKPKPLKVIIIPHSHNDPGWLVTYDLSYRAYSKKTLNLLIQYLTKNPKWKFIWSEVCFLTKWWSEASRDKRKQMKQLLLNGQLEIVTGGFVMSDEATTHYTTVLDQLIEGHQWLNMYLGFIPNISWSVDPFGHSPSMTYLLRRSGIKASVIQRVNFAVKRHLAKLRGLEFHWRQTWAMDNSTDMFSHILPFQSYSISHSCGPDSHVCCLFDFWRKKCYHGNKLVQAAAVNENNIDQLAWELWEQYQKKAELFRGGVILVPHGDDFRYTNASEWLLQFQNMEKLMNYINKQPAMNMEIKFGTVTDYFQELSQNSKVTYPSLSGDFFPYNDRYDQHWTGYYTSRPHHKFMSRKLQNLLRSVEIIFTLMLVRSRKSKNTVLTSSVLKYQSALNIGRQELALFHHHDAITGTARREVMADYAQRMTKAYKKLKELYQFLLTIAMDMTTIDNQPSEQHYKVTLLEDWIYYDGLPVQETVFVHKSRIILIHNPQSQNREDVVHINIDSSEVKVIDLMTNQDVLHQISPVWNGTIFRTDIVELSFVISQSPLSVRNFLIVPDKHSQSELRAQVMEVTEGSDINEALRTNLFKVQQIKVSKFSITNTQMTAIFYTCNGRLQRIVRHEDGKTVKTEIQMLKYETGSSYNPFKDKSGAYIFLPDGHAKDLSEGVSGIYVITGPVYSRVITIQHSVSQSVILYNVTGPLGSGVHVENLVDLHINNTELVMRVDSSVRDAENMICTDLNGFQMHRKKKRNKLKIQGNFHPMTTMSAIEDNYNRLTLLTLGSHGVASLQPGWLEVVLDRRLIQDDWRGLEEGITDNVPTISKFIILVERKERNFASSSVCYPSLLATILSDQLQYPSHVSTVSLLPSQQLALFQFNNQTDLLNHPLPYDVILMNLRSLSNSGKSAEALMVLHRRRLDCGFLSLSSTFLNETTVVLSNLFSDVQICEVNETTLTGTKLVGTVDPELELDIPPMEIKTYKVSLG